MNLGETETYEPGIYQLEITDPVIGGPDGIDNLQAKQLANRTNWLKAKIDSILGMSFIHTAVAENPGDTDEFGYWDSFTQTLRKVTLANFIVTIRTSFDAVYAVLNSPAFTGTPTAPTAPAGTNNTQVATTAYVDGKMVLATAVASISGTSIDFTGIPSWAKRITVMFNGVSTNGTSHLIAQLGDSGGVETTGYLSCAQVSTTPYFSTAGILVNANMLSANNNIGVARFQLISGQTWIGDASLTPHQTNSGSFGSGSKTLSGTLDRIRITTVNGTDTFDAGSINIMYEG